MHVTGEAPESGQIKSMHSVSEQVSSGIHGMHVSS